MLKDKAEEQSRVSAETEERMSDCEGCARRDDELARLKKEGLGLHFAYLRLRQAIPGAFDTQYAPTAEQVWGTTEKALDALRDRHDKLEDEFHKLVEINAFKRGEIICLKAQHEAAQEARDGWKANALSTGAELQHWMRRAREQDEALAESQREIKRLKFHHEEVVEEWDCIVGAWVAEVRAKEAQARAFREALECVQRDLGNQHGICGCVGQALATPPAHSGEQG